ncbi:YicC/YloC family endoribonuclease [Alicyclobacillus dauci]|uniref:YicC family protein n=1 Tax=Alicyclobacillus dauci TaxID=1475485 RepID=A0ABY6YYW5_9BACL|nr:YicC/YloC family endoribonuclease [Alicyclobacillus dauci]WAH35503.1 YicC family protein [Alicyclobacillus dauci]
MAIRSMTGYGRDVQVVADGHVSVEVRTVNHRFSEFHIRLPREWMFLEDAVRKVLARDIQRGRVDVFVSVEGEPSNVDVHVNWALFDKLVEAERELVGRFAEEIHVDTVRDWLKFPDVVQVRPVELAVKDVTCAVNECVSNATLLVIEMRSQEGSRLAQSFTEKLDRLAAHVSIVRDMDRDAITLRTEQLRSRAVQMQLDIEPERLAQEVVLLVDRSAVDEEVVRLASHIDSFREALHRAGPVGRRLDFIVQEMHREVNTIGSKSNDARIAHEVVEMKVLVEQLREQVQNVE